MADTGVSADAGRPVVGGDGPHSEATVFHLPGVSASGIEHWSTLSTPIMSAAVTASGPVPGFRYPILRPQAVGALATQLKDARAEVLAHMPANEIARRVGRVAERFGVRADEWHSRAARALVVATGYSPEMTELGLERMAQDWSPDSLMQLIRTEFAGTDALDAFAPPGAPKSQRALGPELAVNIFAGNVPGVAVTAMIRALLVKSAVLGKTGRDEPVLAPLFAQALAQAEPDIGACVAVSYWPGEHAMTAAALAHADLIVVYGGHDAVDHVSASAPAGRQVVVHGPAVSIGLIAKDALETEEGARALADEAATATAVFDQHGCVSPHTLYVEQGGAVTVERFTELLLAAFERLARELPRGRLTIDEAAAIREVRASAEFRAIDGQDIRVFAGDDLAFTVIVELDPNFTFSCLNRTLHVKPVPSLDQVPTHLESARDLIQTVAFAGADSHRESIANALARLGATRFTSFSDMPWPPPDWLHDGRGPLRELVHFAQIER